MLRRMVYLVIKELGRNEPNVFIVINCLSKDMTSKSELFKANAIRVLSKIIEASMLGQMERFLKQGVVDRNPLVSSCSLLAGQTLFKIAPEIIKRWTNEVQEALSSKNKMVQYHALGLLYLIRKHDRLAITKVVSALSRKPPKSPMAHCLLIRYAVMVLVASNNADKSLIDFLTASLHHKSAMVVFEAAKALCYLPGTNPQQVSPAIAALQELLNSAVPAQRFAAVRTLSKVVDTYPLYVTPCSVDLELLITDSNRSIATLAITTLLKTGVESSVDRLIKSITAFMSEVSDELRIVLVDAVRSLALKFPHKHDVFLEFLSSILREEGGFAYKKSIVMAFFEIMEKVPKSKEMALEYLCDFIEDCEFPMLSVQVLHLLGEEGPKMTNPSRYIRYIFNRVILESPEVRSAAVSSLSKFAAKCPSLSESVKTLLSKCLVDNDDEVRDRAVYYSSALENGSEIAGQNNFRVPLKVLEYSLDQYLQGPTIEPFSMETDIVTPDEVEEEEEEAIRTETKEVDTIKFNVTSGLDILNSIPEFEHLGEIFASSSIVELTETEAEYRVTCVKHVYHHHIVFQFNVTNHMEDQLLASVSVELEPEHSEWFEEMSVPVEYLAPNESGILFSCMKRPDDEFGGTSISALLKFIVKDPEGDIEDEGIEDEYQLEAIEVLSTDFIRKSEDMDVQQFRKNWEGIGAESEVIKRFGLAMNSLQDALNAVVDLLNMQPIGGSSTVAEGSRSHTVNLAGEFMNGDPIYARAGFLLDSKTGVTLKIASRSTSLELSQIVPQAIQ